MGDSSNKPEPVKGEVLGVPKPEPSLEQILAGEIGNGVREKFKSEAAKMLNAERKKARIEKKQARIEAYEEGVKDALQDIAAIESQMRAILSGCVAKALAGEILTPGEMELLKVGMKSIEAAKDRAMGKATTRIESTNQTTILGAIANLNAEWPAPGE